MKSKEQWIAEARVNMAENPEDVDALMGLAVDSGGDYTREQVAVAWAIHSDDFSAGWMTVMDSAAFHLGRWIDRACAVLR